MRKSSEPFLHPAVLILLAAIAVVALVRYLEPARSRQRAMRAFAERSLLLKPAQPIPFLDRDVEPGDAGMVALEPVESEPVFDDWYLDKDTEMLRCAFDYDPDGKTRFVLRGPTLSTGIDLLLSAQDLAFVAWTSFTYRLNPHFLMGVMMAESNGDCSAVSSAGAQGCFQITYRQGAGQLRNSYPERVASWYWAPRSSGAGAERRAGEALGYWPKDLYIEPESYFGFPVPKGTRQLRMTLDPVATLMTSSRVGDTEVSSVANFSFGAVGAGLYYHWLNHYLYSHIDQVRNVIRDLVSEPGAKAMWMAASYNQGAPRTMIALGRYGREQMWHHTDSSVAQYATTVSDYCEQLQLGKETYGGQMTFGQFSDFLQQLRWTYSEVPIDWEWLQDQIKRRHFANGRVIDLETDLFAIFRTMVALEPRLGPETPVLDHHVNF